MELIDIQQKILEKAKGYTKQYNIELTPDFVLIKLYEEVGELSQAYLVHQKKSRPTKYQDSSQVKESLSQELADVLGMSMTLAALLDIDLEEALNKKWEI